MPLRRTPNSWVTFDSDATTQLTYAMLTNPAPLTISLPGEDATLASLQVVITNGTGATVDVTGITFTVQVGTDAPLMQTTQNVLTAVSDTTDWTFSGPGSVITSGPAAFSLAPASGTSVTLDAGASVVVDIYQFPTVLAPVTSTIVVKEMLDGSAPAFANFGITTFPYGFYFDGLVVTVEEGSSLVPVAQVVSGANVTLVWNSSVVDTSAVTIYYSSATEGQQSASPSTLGTWATPALTSDTMFTVVVTASVTGGVPISAALSTAVSVQNPSLVAAAITTGQATVNGAASIGGALSANAIAATGVTVNGALTAGNTAVSSLSAASAAVTGAISAGSLTSSGAITSNGGSSALANLSVGGALSAVNATVSSAFRATGSVAMLNYSQLLSAGSYTANTDGFVIGVVWWPSSVSPAAIAWVSASANGIWMVATGGNVGSFGKHWTDCMNANGNSFTLPVPAGSGFGVSINQAPSGTCQQTNANTAAYWVPIGAGGASASDTIVRTSEQPPEMPAGFVPPGSTSVTRGDEAALEAASVLEQILGKKIDGDNRSALVAALRKIGRG